LSMPVFCLAAYALSLLAFIGKVSSFQTAARRTTRAALREGGASRCLPPPHLARVREIMTPLPRNAHSFREFSNCGERASKLFGNRHENGGSNGSLLAP
jgi:hypothetical protein